MAVSLIRRSELLCLLIPNGGMRRVSASRAGRCVLRRRGKELIRMSMISDHISWRLTMRPRKRAIQRDIFVFQCNIGCRIGDLLRLKKRDVINGAIEYIPTKTIKENARTVVVPLNSVAQEIVDRYADYPGDKLLPFESSERFNDNIKIIFEKAEALVRLQRPLPEMRILRPAFSIFSIRRTLLPLRAAVAAAIRPAAPAPITITSYIVNFKFSTNVQNCLQICSIFCGNGAYSLKLFIFAW